MSHRDAWPSGFRRLRPLLMELPSIRPPGTWNQPCNLQKVAQDCPVKTNAFESVVFSGTLYVLFHCIFLYCATDMLWDFILRAC